MCISNTSIYPLDHQMQQGFVMTSVRSWLLTTYTDSVFSLEPCVPESVRCTPGHPRKRGSHYGYTAFPTLSHLLLLAYIAWVYTLHDGLTDTLLGNQLRASPTTEMGRSRRSGPKAPCCHLDQDTWDGGSEERKVGRVGSYWGVTLTIY